MKNNLQKLPKDVQSFENLITMNYLYVDKTKYILNLVNEGKSFFLSRPRRFGKSLFISTLEEFFKGNKELFKGLYIYNNWDWTKINPVIKVDFTEIGHGPSDDFKRNLNFYMDEIARDFNLSLISQDVPDKFRELIKGIYEKFGERVVVLVDEYDAPIIDSINDDETKERNKTILSSFYKVLKSRDEDLHFVFITGVSKFTGTSIFSGFNSPTDITLNEDYSTICGYTQDELEENFKPFIERLSKKENKTFKESLDKIKHWYDGYSWDGKNFVYSPFSTVLLLYFRRYSNSWFSSGTPTFLIKTIKNKNDLNLIFKDNIVDVDFNVAYDENLDIDTLPLMFQSGYLTIKDCVFNEEEDAFVLSIPNKEVRDSITKYLLNAYSNYPIDKIGSLRIQMKKNIIAKDDNAFALNIREAMANVPYQTKNKKHFEGYYQGLFSLMIYLFGFEIDGEIQTHNGRIDAVIKINQEDIYIIEIKLANKEESIDKELENALNQIHEKRYYDKYLSKNSITLLAIAYSEKDVKCDFIDLNPNDLNAHT